MGSSMRHPTKQDIFKHFLHPRYIKVRVKFKPNSGQITIENKKPMSIGPQREKTCLRGVANNKGADQPALPGSLISAFIIRL